MNRTVAILAFVVLGVILMGSFPTTDKSSGTDKSWASVTATGQIIGPTGEIGAGVTFVSLAEIISGTGTSTFEIAYRKRPGTAETDTIELGNGVPLNEFFQFGVDSLNCLTLGSGARYLVGTSN